MNELIEKLFVLADQLQNSAKEFKGSELDAALQRARDAAEEIGKAWSGSWLGYQSRVYYADLQPVPPGAYFSIEWGFKEAFSNDSRGNWSEYSFEAVRNAVYARARIESLEMQKELATNSRKLFDQAREEFLSASVICLERQQDAFLSRLKEQGESLKVLGEHQLIRAAQPGKFMSRDSIAIDQRMKCPPHVAVLAEAASAEQTFESCEKLGVLIRRAASHLQNKKRQKKEGGSVGINVFIGHGRSSLWKDLKDFVQDRLRMPWDEFNRIPVAGFSNSARLTQMLNEAAIAFLVLTADDEQKDGKVHARMNVIHEAGLFQGKLGFARAILLLEEGCEEFSNIHGLGQIRFPKNNIKAAFEEVRLVLEREKMIE